MKNRYFLQASLLLCVVVMFAACKKEDQNRDYIAFTLDGKQVRIEHHATTEGNIDATVTTAPGTTTRILSIGYFGTIVGLPSGGSFGVYSPQDFAPGVYIADGSTTEGLLYFPTFLFSYQNQFNYVVTPQSTGSITLTHVEGYNPGDVIRGTFTFSNAKKENSNTQQVISNDIAIVEGSFRVTLY